MNTRFGVMLTELSHLLRDAAREELLPRFILPVIEQRTKADGSLVTDADKAIQQRIAKMLKEQWPEIVFLGEEMSMEQQSRLLQNQSVWCVDPLDGTSNFASGIPFFAISLAVIEHQRPVLGLVYDPLRDECFTAVRGQGCWLNGEAMPAPNSGNQLTDLGQMIAVVDLKRLTAPLSVSVVTQHPFRSQRNFGSCALEWCWLAAGRIQLYLHGGQKIWDYAAGALILDEAKGVSATLEGNEVFTASLTPRSVVAAYSENAFQLWSNWIEERASGNTDI